MKVIVIKVGDVYITDDDFQRAEENGICKKTLFNRINYLGWDKETAITTKPLNGGMAKRHKYMDIVKKNGINPETFRYRLKRGWDELEAATLPPKDKSISLLKSVERRRKYPKELLEIADKNGIRRRLFYTRIERGMTPMEAATTPLVSPTEKARRATLKRKENNSFCCRVLGAKTHISKATRLYEDSINTDINDESLLINGKRYIVQDSCKEDMIRLNQEYLKDIFQKRYPIKDKIYSHILIDSMGILWAIKIKGGAWQNED